MPTILVVDDEPLVLRVVARTLELFGYGALAAGSADEALELASRHAGQIDLLIVDHSTQDPEGKLTQIREQHPGIRVLRYSGHAEQDLRETGEMFPRGSFLQKPFKPRQLVAAVKESLGEDPYASRV